MKKKSSKFDMRNEIFFLTLKQTNDKIEFNINCQSSFQNVSYGKEFALGDLQKISKYFQLFDTIDECYLDLKQKFDQDNYEMILKEINEKIILKIKINIANKDFNLDIPIKKPEQEKIYCKFIFSNSKNSINSDDSTSMKYIEKLDNYFDKKLKIFQKRMISNYDESDIVDDNNKNNEDIEEETNKRKNNKNKLFAKSTIIENDYDRRLLKKMINLKRKFFQYYYLRHLLMEMIPKNFMKNAISMEPL